MGEEGWGGGASGTGTCTMISTHILYFSIYLYMWLFHYFNDEHDCSGFHSPSVRLPLSVSVSVSLCVFVSLSLSL